MAEKALGHNRPEPEPLVLQDIVRLFPFFGLALVFPDIARLDPAMDPLILDPVVCTLQLAMLLLSNI
jgi:hypothetical protein